MLISPLVKTSLSKVATPQTIIGKFGGWATTISPLLSRKILSNNVLSIVGMYLPIHEWMLNNWRFLIHDFDSIAVEGL